MRRRFIVIAALIAGASRALKAQSCAVDSKATWYRRQMAWLGESGTPTNDTLRVQLLRAMNADTASLRKPQLGASLLSASNSAIDTAALAILREGAKKREWPTRSVVGVAASRAAVRLAELDTALERNALHRLMEAGPGEALPADVAVIEDRIRVRAGRGQLYGTQLREVSVDGVSKLVPSRIEDSAHVDMRRASASLPPLSLGVCLANQNKR